MIYYELELDYPMYPNKCGKIPFTTMGRAIKYAEKDYGHSINWIDTANGKSSGDLRFVIYTIREKKME